MCDYCDCRLQPEISTLSEQHDELLALLARLRRADRAGRPPEEIDALRDRIAQVLLPHARREEQGVFAALRRAGTDDRYVSTFEDDHATVDALLRGEDVVALVDLLEDHIFREETDLFPAARQILGPADWDVVDEVSA